MDLYDNSRLLKKSQSLDAAQACELLEQGSYGTLSMVESRGGEIASYGIPVNFVWDGGSNIFVHCALQGHKLSCLDAHPLVSLSIVGSAEVVAKEFTTTYQSVVVRGEVKRHLSESQRKEAMRLLLKKYTPQLLDEGLSHVERLITVTEILRIEITEFSGKFQRC